MTMNANAVSHLYKNKKPKDVLQCLKTASKSSSISIEELGSIILGKTLIVDIPYTIRNSSTYYFCHENNHKV